MAFHIRYIHFIHQIIPFSFSNVLANFQKYIYKILAKNFDIFVVVYLSDTLYHIDNIDNFYAVYCIMYLLIV